MQKYKILIQSNEQLISCLESKYSAKFLYFWGHENSRSSINKSCLSQWYSSAFEDNSTVFKTAEHYMMYHKAIYFGESVIANKILESKSPGEAKNLGRTIGSFIDSEWELVRFQIVVHGNFLKFTQNPELGRFLINTNERVLVEASPIDLIWGVGLSVDDERINDVKQWKGDNLLGYALMKVRNLLVQGN